MMSVREPILKPVAIADLAPDPDDGRRSGGQGEAQALA